MAGESPREVVVGLLRQLLISAEAGKIDAVIVGVVEHRMMGIHHYARIYSAGDLSDVSIKKGMERTAEMVGESDLSSHHWTRIPQVQALP